MWRWQQRCGGPVSCGRTRAGRRCRDGALPGGPVRDAAKEGGNRGCTPTNTDRPAAARCFLTNPAGWMILARRGWSMVRSPFAFIRGCQGSVRKHLNRILRQVRVVVCDVATGIARLFPGRPTFCLGDGGMRPDESIWRGRRLSVPWDKVWMKRAMPSGRPGCRSGKRPCLARATSRGLATGQTDRTAARR